MPPKPAGRKNKRTARFRCGGTCLFVGTVLVCLAAVMVTQEAIFLLVINCMFDALNNFDATPSDKTYNAYSGTPVADFFQPLREEEISTIWHDISPRAGGQIPEALHHGILFRIGSNQYYPARTNLHIWEGDAVLHAFRFNSDTNSLSVSSSFMNTPKLQKEKQWKQGIYQAGTEDLLMALCKDSNITGGELSAFQRAVKWIKFFVGRFIDGNILSPFSKYKVSSPQQSRHFFHCANTDILQWNNRLFATCEGSVFFEFAVDTNTMEIDSIGFTNLNESWNKYPFIAHPRIDRSDDKHPLLQVVGHDLEAGNDLIGVGIFDADNRLLNQADIPLNHAQELHDMSATDDYLIVHDFNAWFGTDMIRKYGELIRFEPNVSSRFGVIHKQSFIDGLVNVNWFDIEPSITFHMANAWEEGDEIRLIGARMRNFDFNGLLHFNAVKDRQDEANAAVLHEWRLNMKTGKVDERVISESDDYKNLEMPIIHPLFEGKKTKYIWFNLIDFSKEGFGASSSGIVKYDVDKAKIVGKIEYEEANGKKGSYQAVFVPKERRNIDKVEAEDDGYLLNIVWNENSQKSNIQIFDAKAMSSTPLAIIDLPYRIPGGFHSRFYFV